MWLWEKAKVNERLRMMTKSVCLLWLLLLLRRMGASCFVPAAISIRRLTVTTSPSYHIFQPNPITPPRAVLQLSSNPFLHSPLAMTSTASATSILIRAALTLIVSAAAGIMYDKKRGGGLGTLVTLLVAAHATNMNLSPSHSVLYEFCWKTLLPASLALLLLASPSQKDRQSSRQDIRAVAIPFCIASLGSILGCLFSFFFTLTGAMNSAGRRFLRPGRLLLPPIEGAVQAGCLCASYIGGPVNYFGVRHLLASNPEILGHDGGVLESLFGSSISDLIIMALYFSVSTTALNSKRLQRWFPEREPEDASCDDSSTMNESEPYSKRRRIVATIMAAFLAGEMVKVSTRLGRANLIPGVPTVYLAGLGAISSNLLPRILSLFNADTLAAEIRSVSISLSDVCFYLLFAAIGVSANLREAVQLGGWHFCSGAIFASVALLLHISTLIGGSLAVQRLFQAGLSLEEILVASNAAIGGPVTAAEFANRTTRRRRGLIMAGTVWGVFGYVIATEVGLTMTRLLLPLVMRFIE